MKYIITSILAVLISAIIISGCDDYDDNIRSRKTRITINDANILEIEVDHKTHEYIQYWKGITHYPECKYCRDNKYY